MKKILLMLALVCAFNLSDAQSSRRSYRYENKNSGWVLTLSGFTFTTAAILEGNKNYTTYVRNGNQVQKYTKPFLSQTPRQIVFFTGITLTFTGLITTIAQRR